MAETVEIPMDTYLSLLDARREFIAEHYDWRHIPDKIWDYVIESIEKNGVDPERSDPSYIVDNLAINAVFGPIENYVDMDAAIERLRKDYADEPDFDAEEWIRENTGNFWRDYAGNKSELLMCYDEFGEYGVGVVLSL
jgi:hypothetical protein